MNEYMGVTLEKWHWLTNSFDNYWPTMQKDAEDFVMQYDCAKEIQIYSAYPLC